MSDILKYCSVTNGKKVVLIYLYIHQDVELSENALLQLGLGNWQY